MTTTYLSSPSNQMTASYMARMPVLLSFALEARQTWLQKYIPTFGRVMADSGAYSEMSSGKVVDLDEYGQWVEEARLTLDAAAALDDIRGDWRRSLRNWDSLPHTFPVLHDSDPPEYIAAVIERLGDPARARLRPTDLQWCGIGLVPPRSNTQFALRMLGMIPPGVHVHLFALRKIASAALAVRGFDVSFDSTTWLLDAFAIGKQLPWLTTAECVDLVVRRYQRAIPKPDTSTQGDLFS